MKLADRLTTYHLTAVFSLLFAVLGFSYNVWRITQSEHNTTVRTASFEIFKQLSVIEQVVYSAYYDNAPVAGNPRRAWVAVGLVRDLSQLTPADNQLAADNLHKVWSQQWPSVASERLAVDKVVEAIDGLRAEIKYTLSNLD